MLPSEEIRQLLATHLDVTCVEQAILVWLDAHCPHCVDPDRRQLDQVVAGMAAGAAGARERRREGDAELVHSLRKAADDLRSDRAVAYYAIADMVAQAAAALDR